MEEIRSFSAKGEGEMAEFENFRRMINPCLLQLQKMELELKCPSWYFVPSLIRLLFANFLLCDIYKPFEIYVDV